MSGQSVASRQAAGGTDTALLDPQTQRARVTPAVMHFLVPIRTMSEANLREHWGKKARRVKVQRQAVAWSWQMQKLGNRIMVAKRVDETGLVITLTRIAHRKLDTDNLARSFKAVRDEIAHCLVVDDGSDKLDWRYAQRLGKAKEYAVEVDIR